jgi:hypothetical protein
LRRAAKVSVKQGGLRSGIVGFWEEPNYCRITEFSRDDAEGWQDIQFLLRDLCRVYRDTAPERYAAQKRVWNLTSPDFRIPGTVFTTATVNRNAIHPPHRHEENLSLGLSVMTVLRRGDYSGGLFLLPEYNVALDLQDRDVILFESSAEHANTPMLGDGERISVVGYYRSRMIEAGSVEEEYQKANRIETK